jgi:streptogramin lyase
VVLTKTLPVISDLATLPSGSRAAILIAATSNAGTLTGALAVEARGSTPATGEANITDAGTQIEFAAADAVTECTVTYVQQPDSGGDVGVNTALEAQGAL